MNAMLCLILSILLIPFVSGDDLAEIQKRGVLVAGVKDATPPFGMRDARKNTIAGYDVDFAIAIARRLGVKILAKPVSSADRIPQLQDGKIDLIIATLTKNTERARLVDFSYGYFITAQKFAVHRGTVRSLGDLSDKVIGTGAGSNSEIQLRREIPSAKVVLYPDYNKAFLDLQAGKIDAVSTDEPILSGQLNNMPNKANFEIPDLPISIEVYAVAVRQGQPRLLQEINATLLELEKSGEAEKIFNRWFGPGTRAPLHRVFKITSR